MALLGWLLRFVSNAVMVGGSARRVALTHADESSSLLAMTKRLQVLLDDDELAEIRELARRRRQTTAAWVREALRRAREETVYPDAVRKLKAVREASAHAYPIADPDQVAAEIERGYLDDGA
jgi:hypothetical protein